jgi:hypothetical protein
VFIGCQAATCILRLASVPEFTRRISFSKRPEVNGQEELKKSSVVEVARWAEQLQRFASCPLEKAPQVSRGASLFA